MGKNIKVLDFGFSHSSERWWPHTSKPGFWSVHSDFWGHSLAVVDDFGNLVRVAA